MTPSEFRLQLKEWSKANIGSGAWIYVHVIDEDLSRPALGATIARSFDDKDKRLRVDSDTFEELLQQIQIEWPRLAETWSREIIKRMALEIIRITDERGKCIEADLRMTYTNSKNGFSELDIAAYSAIACAMADEMAGKGPFTIEKGAKGNAP